jgi:hypothetical protein
MAASRCIAGVIRPRDLQLRDVEPVYLIEIRVPAIAGVAARRFPVGVGAREWRRRRSGAGNREKS